jgi:uncharacterized protein with von Willebrand factor type A (vWA) domain
MTSFRYGPWRGGADPLASPFDAAAALDELGDSVLAGNSPAEALQQMLRRGRGGHAGLDDLLRQVRDRRRELRRAGRLDGTLRQVRELLDRALGQERAALFPDPSDEARLRETELDNLPSDTARAVRQLADYEWRSPDARQTFEEIRDLLRREVLDSQFRGLKQTLERSDPSEWQRVQEMLGALNDMLDADARGEDVGARFAEFMRRYGDLFPDNPNDLGELVDGLARRAAAAARLLSSLSPQQRDELAGLVAGALGGDLGLDLQMSRLTDHLQARRPDLDWTGRQRMHGAEPLGLGDATTALEELAELGELSNALEQDYAGASLDDIDEDAVARALGRPAVDDLAALRQLERELTAQGFVRRDGSRLELTPQAIRRLGSTALRRVFAELAAARSGQHDLHDAGPAGDPTGSSRPWQFGDEQPIDVVRTLRNAVRRSTPGASPALQLQVDDFEVVETDRRCSAAVALLVDLSYSMALRGTWGTAKSTALALHSLVSTKYPQDAVQIIGFSNYARVLPPEELVELSWDMVQGTNLQHALLLAGRHLSRHAQAEPVVLVVTDGEPTAHLTRDGGWFFDWPPANETLELTLAEADRLTRSGATINVFMLDDDPRLVRFVDRLAQRAGGRVFAPRPERLGEYVVSDYLRSRRGRAVR